MGCLLCNITSCEQFPQGKSPPINNPFFCKTKQSRELFLRELAYDIACQHPEMVNKINDYIRRKGGICPRQSR